MKFVAVDPQQDKNVFSVKEKPKQVDNGPVLFLSLFLLLLAFFILLNALSTIEDNEFQKVLSSFNNTSLPTRVNEGVDKVEISTFGPAPTPQESMEVAKKMWVSAVPIAKVKLFSQGERMLVEMPYNEVFVEGSDAVRADRLRLFTNMSKIMAAKYTDFEIAVDITLFIDKFMDLSTESASEPILDTAALSLDLQTTLARRDDLNIATDLTPKQNTIRLGMLRAISLGKSFMEQEIPRGFIRTSLRQDEKALSDLLRLQFYVREAGRDKIDLKSLISFKFDEGAT